MKNGQVGYLLKIILLIECQNIGDPIIFHNDAVNDVTEARMIFKNALPHVIEEF